MFVQDGTLDKPEVDRVVKYCIDWQSQLAMKQMAQAAQPVRTILLTLSPRGRPALFCTSRVSQAAPKIDTKITWAGMSTALGFTDAGVPRSGTGASASTVADHVSLFLRARMQRRRSLSKTWRPMSMRPPT